MKFDGIRKLLESGTLIAYNTDQILKEKLDLVQVSLDIRFNLFAKHMVSSRHYLYKFGNEGNDGENSETEPVQFLLVTKQYLLTTLGRVLPGKLF